MVMVFARVETPTEDQRITRSDEQETPEPAPTLATETPQPCSPTQPPPQVESRTFGSIAFVQITAGNFQMGSTNGDDDEQPVHCVTISQPFYMSATEVTQGQWEAVMGTTVAEQRDKADPDRSLRGVGAAYPMYYVSWEEVQEFIRRLNQQEGCGDCYRLPTEAEWEYAARAGTAGDYAGDLDAMGWYSGNSGGETHRVGQKARNGWGLYDMHGNMWEWVGDWYGDYSSGAETDPPGPATGSFRVIRGGSWYFAARDARSADRTYFAPGSRGYDLGFRLVRTAL